MKATKQSKKSKSLCCGPKPTKTSKIDSSLDSALVSKLTSPAHTAASKESVVLSSELFPIAKKRDWLSKSDDEFDNRNVDHNPKSLILYQKQIEIKCDDSCPTKRNFTVDIANKYCNTQTSKNIDMATIIAVKIVHPGAPCPYAIDAESYTVFREFFHPLILDLQNITEIVDTCQGLEFGDAESFQDVDLNADSKVLRVMFCEIVVRRNLNDYNLSGCLKMENKLMVMHMLKDKFREIFSSLNPITIPSEWTSRLIDDEPYLLESRALNNYPKGRLNMVYKDDQDCTIGCIINYDDHLQVVFSTNNGKLGYIFNQADKILNSTIMTKMEFMKHQKYGYITYSPQYLGTGFSIRLTVRMFFVCLMDDVEDLYLKDIGLMLQNIQDPSKGLAILSNRKTMGVTEIEIFQNILEGIRRLFELDQELKNTSPNSVVDRTMPVEALTFLATKIYNNETAHTYTKKYLTDTIIQQYQNIPTNLSGLFNHCIRANAFYPKSLFPKACDADCYTTFCRFFNPIILEANHCRQFMHNPNPIYGVANTENRYKLQHRLINGYRVRFSRNLEDYPFPMLMSPDERKEIENKMIDAFETFPNEISGTYISLENITKSKSFQFLEELRLIPKANDPIKRASWIYRDWPKNRGLFLAKRNHNYEDNVLIIIVNEVDHFQVSCINYVGQRIDYCYDRAVIAMKQLDTFFGNAYCKKPNYGYLSSVPQNVGCSMRVGVRICLKNLGANREIFDEFCFLNNMNYRGTRGSGTLSENDIFDVSLKLNLNYSEIQILMIFIQRLKDLILEERTFDNTIPKPINYRTSVGFLPVIGKDESDQNSGSMTNTTYTTMTSIESTESERKDTSQNRSIPSTTIGVEPTQS